ncbi:MAG: hypothetical protein ACLUHB_06010 [Odoribacter splanchnicus]
MQSKEQFDLEPCEWTACNPQTSPLFTAVGYFFGKELQPEIGVPVGLIHTSWGRYRYRNLDQLGDGC